MFCQQDGSIWVKSRESTLDPKKNRWYWTNTLYSQLIPSLFLLDTWCWNQFKCWISAESNMRSQALWSRWDVVVTMVTAVCWSSPREIENRIEADHPVVSLLLLLLFLLDLLVLLLLLLCSSLFWIKMRDVQENPFLHVIWMEYIPQTNLDRSVILHKGLQKTEHLNPDEAQPFARRFFHRGMFLNLVFPFHSLLFCLLSSRLRDASAGAGLSRGGERGGPAVQDYFSGDSWRSEYEFCPHTPSSDSRLLSSSPSSALWLLFWQDMEITANELRNVLNRVITKRESIWNLIHSVFVSVSTRLNSCSALCVCLCR